MSEKLTLSTTVRFGDVDREETIGLSALFKMLQEAAIAQANRYDTGTRAMATRGESWVLNRIAVAIRRYPRYEEPLRVETWSSGIDRFKGYREFRVYDRDGALAIEGSSLWLYVNVRSKAIVRVPREVADSFPMNDGPRHCPGLDQLDFAAPDAATGALVVPVTVRYDDIDANAHVNNTAYLAFVQTALARAGFAARPAAVRLRYLKAIPAEAAAVTVSVAARAGGGAAFGIACDGALCAAGEAA